MLTHHIIAEIIGSVLGRKTAGVSSAATKRFNGDLQKHLIESSSSLANNNSLIGPLFLHTMDTLCVHY